MSTTYAILGVSGSSVLAVDNLPMIDPTKFSLVDTIVNADGSRESVFQRTEGDVEHPLQIRVGVYPKTTEPKTYNISIRVTGFATRTENSETVYAPYSAVLAWTMPWAPVLVAADQLALLGNLFSWAVPDVVTGSLDTNFIERLAYSLTELDLGSVIRTA